MGLFFIILSVVFMTLSFVGVFIPSVLGQKKRIHAFFIGLSACWLCVGVGVYVDDGFSFWGVFWFCLPLFITCLVIAKPQFSTEQKTTAQAVFELNETLKDKQHDTTITEAAVAKPQQRKASFDRSFKSWESELTTAWTGDTDDIEFTYVNKKGERTRRSVTVEELLYNESMEFYIKGYCHVRGEQRTFKADNIDTKIKVGSQRLDFDDWCERKLGIDLYDLYHA